MDMSHIPMQDLVETYDMKVSEIKDTDQDTSTVENAIKNILSKADTLIGYVDEIDDDNFDIDPAIEHLKSLDFNLQGIDQLLVQNIKLIMFLLFAGPESGVVQKSPDEDDNQELRDRFQEKNVLTTDKNISDKAKNEMKSVTYICLDEASPLGIHFENICSNEPTRSVMM